MRLRFILFLGFMSLFVGSTNSWAAGNLNCTPVSSLSPGTYDNSATYGSLSNKNNCDDFGQLYEYSVSGYTLAITYNTCNQCASGYHSVEDVAADKDDACGVGTYGCEATQSPPQASCSENSYPCSGTNWSNGGLYDRSACETESTLCFNIDTGGSTQQEIQFFTCSSCKTGYHPETKSFMYPGGGLDNCGPYAFTDCVKDTTQPENPENPDPPVIPDPEPDPENTPCDPDPDGTGCAGTTCTELNDTTTCTGNTLYYSKYGVKVTSCSNCECGSKEQQRLLPQGKTKEKECYVTYNTCKTSSCTDCKSDDDFQDTDTRGLQKKVTRECVCGSCDPTNTEYRCIKDYYGTPTADAPLCTYCPKIEGIQSHTEAEGSTSKGQCCVSAGIGGSDSGGYYVMEESCCATE